MKRAVYLVLVMFVFTACDSGQKNMSEKNGSLIDKKVASYVDFRLTSDMYEFSGDEKLMMEKLLKASDLMDDIFWMQSCGEGKAKLDKLPDGAEKLFFEINYGPWDRLDGNKPFVKEVGDKPLGAAFYPKDMSFDEFNAIAGDSKYSFYTLVKRNESGGLEIVPYHKAYEGKLKKAAILLSEAADLSSNKNLGLYLKSLSADLMKDDFKDSYQKWLALKDSEVDVVFGPFGEGDDRFMWTKHAYGAFVMLKDIEQSKRLEKYSLLLPYLQKNLPVGDELKTEDPVLNSDISVYDLIYNKGCYNTGSKKISINLPSNEEAHLSFGSRKLIFKNVIKAKFEKILLPIGLEVITESQRKHLSFDAFFHNTMFYEISRGLGIKNTINNKGLVRDALKDHSQVIESGKADILSLFFITKLHDMGELPNFDLRDIYVTYMADMIRSVRFGVTNSQAVSNMIRFNYFKAKGAFIRTPRGLYKVDFEKMREAMLSLSKELLEIQGNGDYSAADKMIQEQGFIKDELIDDLYRIKEASIPKDIYFVQGAEYLNLKN
jgi:hypothetical protein